MLDREGETEDRRRRRRRLRWLSLLAGVLVVAVGVLMSMNLLAGKADGASQEKSSGAASQASADGDQAADAEGKAPVPVEVATVKPGTVSAYISSTANLIAEFDVQVLAEVEGRVASLQVDEGDFVRQGQVLAGLIRDDEQISVKKAELKEANARMAFDRGRDLIDKELISREEFDTLTIEHRIAEQELAEARWSLEKATIRAPFSGRLTQRLIQVGQHVQVGDPLFQVTDFEPLIARLYLPERDVLGLNVGREVRIRLNADPDVAFAGRIRQISPVVDTATGTVKITVEAAEPPAAVRPGSFVTVDIVRETRSETLLVPREAVLRELKKVHVFVASGDTAQKRQVTLGLEEGEFIEAVSGVQAGDRVIVAGQGGLKDGSAIKILTAADSTG